MVGDPGGKSARTYWKRIANVGGRALIEFAPETGRTHQLRVHALEGLHAPIVGDPVYGRASEPMLLHAWKLTVPREGKPLVEAIAPLPERFAAAGFDHAG